jgi:hypothetical protein
MVRNRTRKANKIDEKGTKTIPELRRAFEHIERFIQTSEGRELTAFRKEWKRMFGKDVSKSAATNYLRFASKTPVQKGGGMALSPAPLSYDMRAGTGSVHMPPYVASGFGFANNLSFGANGRPENITPNLPEGLGSNAVQKGGARMKKTRRAMKVQQGGGSLMESISTALLRPFTATTPPSTAQALQHTIKGQEPLPTGDVTENPNIKV